MTQNTYVVYRTSYMDEESWMYEFTGTYNALLRHLCGIDGMSAEELEDDYGIDASQLTDEYMEELFKKSDGDGQPAHSVWCVNEHKKVLG